MAWWKHHQNTPVLAEKLEPGGLRRKLRHLAQLLLVNQNGDGGPGPRREWGPGPPQIAAPVGGKRRGLPAIWGRARGAGEAFSPIADISAYPRARGAPGAPPAAPRPL